MPNTSTPRALSVPLTGGVPRVRTTRANRTAPAGVSAGDPPAASRWALRIRADHIHSRFGLKPLSALNFSALSPLARQVVTRSSQIFASASVVMHPTLTDRIHVRKNGVRAADTQHQAAVASGGLAAAGRRC